MTREIKQSILVTAIVLVAVALDQVLKIYVKTNFALGESYQITSWFWLSFVENDGAHAVYLPKMVIAYSYNNLSNTSEGKEPSRMLS